MGHNAIRIWFGEDGCVINHRVWVWEGHQISELGVVGGLYSIVFGVGS